MRDLLNNLSVFQTLKILAKDKGIKGSEVLK